MPIYAFTGLMGAGKTYHMVRDVIVPAIKDKRQIYTNIPLRISNIETFTDVEIFGASQVVQIIDGEFIKNIHEHQKELVGALVVLDEVHTYFYSANAMWDQALLEFLTYSRHHGIDVVLGTQNLENVNKKLRNLVSNEYRFRAASHLGRLGKGKYSLTKYVGTADSYQDPEIKPEKTHHLYDSKVFRFYHSVEPGTMKAVGIPKQPVPENNSIMMWGGLTAVGLVMVVFLFSGLVSNFNDGSEAVAQVEPEIEVGPVPSRSPASGDPSQYTTGKEKKPVDVSTFPGFSEVFQKPEPPSLPPESPGSVFLDLRGREVLLKGKYKVLGRLRQGDRLLYNLKDEGGGTVSLEMDPNASYYVGQTVEF